jgi:hypothetical protein
MRKASKKIILFLAANPISASRLAFDEECAAIERELQMTTGRNDLDFRSKWAVTAEEMLRHLNELQPTIIHFSGHGYSGPRDRVAMMSRHVACSGQRGQRNNSGLYLHGEHSSPQLITAHALRMMIATAASSARVVVLNACYSSTLASALCTVVDCVVGMAGAIRDEAARSFAVGFYRAIGNYRSVGNAVKQAVATLAVKQLPDEHLPRCRTRKGLNASQIFVSAAPRTVGNVRPHCRARETTGFGRSHPSSTSRAAGRRCRPATLSGSRSEVPQKVRLHGEAWQSELVRKYYAEGHENSRQEGRAEGHREGRAEGHREGRAEGLQEGLRSAALMAMREKLELVTSDDEAVLEAVRDSTLTALVNALIQATGAVEVRAALDGARRSA